VTLAGSRRKVRRKSYYQNADKVDKDNLSRTKNNRLDMAMGFFSWLALHVGLM
jgi:hypothetical protein